MSINCYAVSLVQGPAAAEIRGIGELGHAGLRRIEAGNERRSHRTDAERSASFKWKVGGCAQRKIRRLGETGHVNIVGVIYGDRLDAILSANSGAASQVREIQRSRSSRIQFGDKAGGAGGGYRRRGGGSHAVSLLQIGRKSNSADVGVAGRIQRDSHGHIAAIGVAAAADVGGIDHHRVNRQRLAAVIIRNGETHLMIRNRVISGDLAARAIRVLIHVRLLKFYFTADNIQQQVTVRIQMYLAGAFHIQRNRFGVGAGGDDEIVFQFAAIAVKHQVDARINTGILYFGIGRHIGMPFVRIIPHEIVDLGRGTIEAGYLRAGIRSIQAHAQGREFLRRPRHAAGPIHSQTVGRDWVRGRRLAEGEIRFLPAQR